MPITMAILPAVVPNASAIRDTFCSIGPGASRLTASAAVTSAMNALIRSTTIIPTTTTTPTSRISSGDTCILRESEQRAVVPGC